MAISIKMAICSFTKRLSFPFCFRFLAQKPFDSFCALHNQLPGIIVNTKNKLRLTFNLYRRQEDATTEETDSKYPGTVIVSLKCIHQSGSD